MDLAEARALLCLPPDAELEDLLLALTIARARLAPLRDGAVAEAELDRLDEAVLLVARDIATSRVANRVTAARYDPEPVSEPEPMPAPVPGLPAIRRPEPAVLRRSGWRTALALVVLCPGALVWIGLSGYVYARTSSPWLVAVLLVVGLLGTWTGGQLTSGRGVRHAVVFAAACLPATLLLGNGYAGFVLAARGVTAQAAVTHEWQDTSSGGVTFEYALTAPNGAMIPGGRYTIGVPGPAASPPYRVGDTLTVVYDPRGTVAPEAPEATQTDPTPLTVTSLLALTMLGCYLWWGMSGVAGQH